MAVVTVNESVTTGTAGLKLGAYAVQRFLRGGSMTSAERTAALALMGDGVDLITYHWSGGYSNATPGTQQLGTSDFAPTSMATARDYATHGSKIGLDAAFANLDALIALRPAAKVALVMFDHPQAMLNGATRTTGSNFPWPASTYWGGTYAGTLCDQLIARYGSKILAFSYGQELKGLTNRTDTTQLDAFAAGYTAWATYMRVHHPTVELWYPHLNYFATASLASRQAAVDALIAGGSTLQAADETIINRLMDQVSPTLVDRMTYDVSIVDYNSADTWRNSYAAVASRTTLEYHLQRVLNAKMTSRWSSVKPLVAIESYFNVNQTLEVLDSGSPITPNQQAALATAILIAAQKGGVTYHNRWEPQGGDPGAEAPDGNIASWWDRDGVATPAWYQARDLITAIPAGSTLYTVSSDNSNLVVASGGNNVYILNTSGAAISASVTATSGSLGATSIPAYGYTVRKLPSGSGVPPTPVPPPTDPAPTTTPITYPKNRHHNRMWHIGLVPTDQLGSGTADETTVLYGDNTWGPPSFAGDVTGTAGSLAVVGLRQIVSLSSNIAPSAAVGNVLTLISAGATPVAQFAVPSNSGSASFGSNATRVSASSFVGASTNSAREDHRHDGIGTVTASSSNTMDRGTLNLRAGSNVSFGLTDSDGSGGFDTLTINSTAAGAGGGGTLTDYVSGASGSGHIVNPGLAGSPDNLPASPSVKDDEFSALSGWTTLGTLDTSNVTDLGSHWHGIRACSSDINGLYKAIPSMPFTVTMKVTAHNLVAYSTHPSVGIMLLDSTPTAIREFSYNFASGTTWAVSLRRYTNRTTFSSSVDLTIATPGPGPVYIRLLVTSSSSVTFSYSYNGYFWITPGSLTAISPTLTPAYVGILLSDPITVSSPEAYIDWIRFT